MFTRYIFQQHNGIAKVQSYKPKQSLKANHILQTVTLKHVALDFRLNLSLSGVETVSG